MECLFHYLLVLLNFFFLDRNVSKCAEFHGDKHLNKMQLEYAQIASGVVHMLAEQHSLMVPEGTYKPTHVGHPVVLWAAQSRAHVMWVIDLGIALAAEKTKRAAVRKTLGGKPWKETHKSTPVLEMLNEKMYDKQYFANGDAWTDPPACMPDCVKQKENVVESYRMYYAGPKVDLIGLGWEPYAREPEFVATCRKRLRENEEYQRFVLDARKSVEDKQQRKKAAKKKNKIQKA